MTTIRKNDVPYIYKSITHEEGCALLDGHVKSLLEKKDNEVKDGTVFWLLRESSSTKGMISLDYMIYFKSKKEYKKKLYGCKLERGDDGVTMGFWERCFPPNIEGYYLNAEKLCLFSKDRINKIIISLLNTIQNTSSAKFLLDNQVLPTNSFASELFSTVVKVPDVKDDSPFQVAKPSGSAPKGP